MNKTIFKPMNKHPISIEYQKRDKNEDFNPCFRFKGRQYFLDNFIRTKNNPWVNENEYPEYIDGYESENYIYPLFTDINDDDTVIIYKKGE